METKKTIAIDAMPALPSPYGCLRNPNKTRYGERVCLWHSKKTGEVKFVLERTPSTPESVPGIRRRFAVGTNERNQLWRCREPLASNRKSGKLRMQLGFKVYATANESE